MRASKLPKLLRLLFLMVGMAGFTVPTVVAQEDSTAVADTAAGVGAAIGDVLDSLFSGEPLVIPSDSPAIEIPEIPEIPEFPEMPEVNVPALPELTIPAPPEVAVPEVPPFPALRIDWIMLLLKKKIKPEPSIHGEQLAHYMDPDLYQAKTEKEWHDAMGLINKWPSCIWADTGRTRLIDTLIPRKEVYGYHALWMGDAWKSYSFSLLSSIGYFAYQVDPVTGENLLPDNNWKTTALRDSAARYRTRVDYVLAIYGQKDTETFLRNYKAGRITGFAARLSADLDTARYEGINIDFPNVSSRMADEFQYFVNDLRKRLHRKHRIVITIPAVDWNGVFSPDSLENSAAFFVMTGYDFYHTKNEIAGPPSILHSGESWGGYNIENSVNSYLERGMSKSQLVVSIPYYGKEWSTKTERPGATRATFCSMRPYRFFKENYLMGKSTVDAQGSVSYYIFPYGKRYKQFWFEDTTSLAGKHNYLLNMGLKGVGIWALGYDNGHDELWELIRLKWTVNGRRTQEGDVCKHIRVDTTTPPLPYELIPREPSISLSSSALRQVYEVEYLPEPGLQSDPTDHLPGVISPAIAPNSVFVSTAQIVELIAVAIGILLLFALGGFVIALFYSEKREIVLNRRFKFWVLLYGVLAIILLVLCQVGLVSDSQFTPTFWLLTFAALFAVLLTITNQNAIKSSRASS